MRKPIILLALAAAILPQAAMAADRQTEDFVYRVRAEAAWSGIEVARIAWDGDRVRAYGVDATGRDVTIERACGHDRIVCPPSGLAAKENGPRSQPRIGYDAGETGQP